MSQQLEFDFGGDGRIQEQFEKFHAGHPDVYELFSRLTFQLRDRGHKRYSSDSILHVIRWHYDTSSSGETPKINNNFTSRYVRLFLADHPEFDGFFELRELKS